MLSYSLKVMVMLAYWALACRLFFTETNDPKFIYGVMSMSEAWG